MQGIEYILHFERGKVMKKILLITLSLILVFCMTSALMLNTAAEADPQVLREYERASDGDILFYADFNSTAYKTNECATENLIYTPSEDGRSINIVSKADAVQEYNYYGAAFEQLSVPKDAKVTMTFSIQVDGELTDNKIGIGGWFVDQDPAEADLTKWVVYNEYGVWQGEASEVRIAESKTGKSDYTKNIVEASPDDSGFITVKLEYDASVAKDRKMTTYYLKDGAWVENNTYELKIGKAPTLELLGVYIYSHYVTVDATIKDVKLFKGVGLTPEQIAITENTTNEVEPTTTAEKTAPPPKTQAPTQTNAPAAATTAAESEGGCGGTLTIAAVAMIPALATVAFVANKKKED